MAPTISKRCVHLLKVDCVSYSEFIRTMESQHSFPLYIEMLAAISSSPDSAYAAFMYLKDAHSTKINWTSFFTWIQTFLASFQQNVCHSLLHLCPCFHFLTHSEVQREVSREEYELLTSILRLLKAVVEYDDKSRQSLYTNRFWRPLEVCSCL